MRIITTEPAGEKEETGDLKTRLIRISAIIVAFAVTFFFFVKILFF